SEPVAEVSWSGRELESTDSIYSNPNLANRRGDYLFTFRAERDFGGSLGRMASSQTFLLNLKGRRSHEIRLENIIR
ncbi:MAG: hypothetical protein V2A74_05950, partial [bacterium]